MNITRKIALPLLLVALGAPSAFAAMSGDAGDNAAGIELSGDDAPAQRLFDQTLGMKVPDESLQQGNAWSSLRAPAPMEGHYGRDGANTPELFGPQGPSLFVSQHAASQGIGDSTGLAQMTAVHMVGSGSVTGEAPVASSGVSSPSAEYVLSSTPNTQNAIPLPSALLLMASGIVCLPAIRQRINRAY